MKLKKNALIGILVISLVALLAVGTWAWFTAQTDPVTNTFTAGTVKIKLHDEFAEGGITNWNPGDCTSKVVYVENTGTKCAYVRVKLTPEWSNGEEELDTDNVSWTIGEGWILIDGWYYYKESLKGTAQLTEGEGNAITTNLISEVCLDGPGTSNNYQGVTFTLKVEAEAVQCTNGAAGEVWAEDDIEVDQDGNIVWPEENGEITN